tara:strand:- start:147 stop:293 length:147 start_codon:yes stop_codon:yes gene_type:complete
MLFDSDFSDGLNKSVVLKLATDHIIVVDTGFNQKLAVFGPALSVDLHS